MTPDVTPDVTPEEYFDLANRQYKCDFSEEQRQLMLMALQKLRVECPGFDFALGEIEEQLGGQLDWPPYPERDVVAAALRDLMVAAAPALQASYPKSAWSRQWDNAVLVLDYDPLDPKPLTDELRASLRGEG